MSLINVLEKVFKKKSERDYLRLRPILEEVKQLRAPMAEWPDERLQAQTPSFRERLAKGETLDDLLPEAYATVWEACRRLAERRASWTAFGREQVWDMVPYDVQIIGAIALHQGNIAEMATGEGKTLVATMPLYLNALEGRGAHLVTVNDYLAQRDAEWMGGIYRFLGLTVSFIKNDMTPPQRREAYAADITYGTNNEFGFDYLRDNMAVRAEDLVQRVFHFAIVDEVDSVLVDEARTPLIISGPVGESTHRFGELKPYVDGLVRKQTRLLNGYLDAIEKALEVGEGKIDDATALSLLRVSRGGPKLNRFMKLVKTPGVVDAIRKCEAAYMRDKALWEVDADLYYMIDEKQHSVDLSDKGRDEFGISDPDFFLLPDLAVEVGQIESDASLNDLDKATRIEGLHRVHAERNEGIHNVQQLLRAYALYNKDDEYVVQDDKILIVDEFTGRLMPGRRFSDGLHSALEAKEGVRIEAETQTYATITLQNLFRMYKKLAGMTGTAETEAGEFHEIYKLDVMVIPTNVAICRTDEQDQIFRTKREKYNAIIDEVERLNKMGLPVLVGTTTVEVSETLSRLLKRKGIRHNVLNARHHQREAEIVAEAGQLAAVTIATNMAGRGTDIKLGAGVKTATGDVEGEPAGLHIVGSERHESRRIDRQLRGRSGRQGDPGRSIFYLSLEDDLMRLFGSDRIARLMDRIGLQEGEVITHSMVTKAIEKAQMRVEQQNFSIRKRLLEYDDVMNKQREVVYAWRREALLQEDISASTVELIEDTVADLVEGRCDRSRPADEWDWAGLSLDVSTTFLTMLPIAESHRKTTGFEALLEAIGAAALAAYRSKEQRLTPGITRQLERHVTLRTIDEMWKDHLHELDTLRSGIGLRAFGQKDPLLEYKSESFILFESMMTRVRREIVSRFFRYELVAAPPRPAAVLAGGIARKSEASAYAGASAATAAGSGIASPPPPSATAVGASSASAAAARAFQGSMQGGGPPSAAAAAQAALAPPQAPAAPTVRTGPKVGRNDPCPCGSGRKFKKCHGQE